MTKLVLSFVRVPWQDVSQIIGRGQKALAKREEGMMHKRSGTSTVYEFSLLSISNYLKTKGFRMDEIKNKL